MVRWGIGCAASFTQEAAPPGLALGAAALDDGSTLVEPTAGAHPVGHHGSRAARAGHHVRRADLVMLGSAHVAPAAALASFRNGHDGYSFFIFSSRLLSSASGDSRGSRGAGPPGWLPAGSGGLAAAPSVGKSERRGNIGSSRIRNSRTKPSSTTSCPS